MSESRQRLAERIRVRPPEHRSIRRTVCLSPLADQRLALAAARLNMKPATLASELVTQAIDLLVRD